MYRTGPGQRRIGLNTNRAMTEKPYSTGVPVLSHLAVDKDRKGGEEEAKGERNKEAKTDKLNYS